MLQKKLPVGIEDFAKLRENDYYYVDKTNLIRDLLAIGGEVVLFTRPRRFGKSLNMSMLRYFFEIGTDPELFDGLSISHEKDLCEQYLGQYPVISISLKNVDGMTFEDARVQLLETIKWETRRISYQLKEELLAPEERTDLQALKNGTANLDQSLKLLSGILFRYYGKKAIILIDEYDVPLDKAFSHGYYDQMVLMIRQIFGYALKTNENLEFAVLTGCLRVSKESIFTGLNNMKVLSIIDERYDEWFGFTDEDVRTMLADYGLNEHYEITREWYDGYRFGATDVYCPWDVVNWCEQLKYTTNTRPQNFWINTSGNDMVSRFVYKADRQTRMELEYLIAGKSIKKPLRLDLTYEELDGNIDNLWSVLFTTGYLTQCGVDDEGFYSLRIPNREILEIFKMQIQEWFKDTIQSDSDNLQKLYLAFRQKDADTIEFLVNQFLSKTISILGANAPHGKKENFYHGLLLGLLSTSDNWNVVSNTEAGDGFADICAYSVENDYGFIIEVKYSDSVHTLDSYANKALSQIRDRNYKEFLVNEGISDMTAYGIAFFKKKCKVCALSITE